MHNVLCSKLLRKPEALKTSHDVDREEWKQIDEDLKVTSLQQPSLFIGALFIVSFAEVSAFNSGRNGKVILS